MSPRFLCYDLNLNHVNVAVICIERTLGKVTCRYYEVSEDCVENITRCEVC